MNETLGDQIRAILASENYVEAGWQLLKVYKEDGGTKEEAYATLQSMRASLNDEFEDRVLELMDFVSGWCAAEWRIW